MTVRTYLLEVSKNNGRSWQISRRALPDKKEVIEKMAQMYNWLSRNASEQTLIYRAALYIKATKKEIGEERQDA